MVLRTRIEEQLLVLYEGEQLLRRRSFREARQQRLLELPVQREVWDPAGVVEQLPEGHLPPSLRQLRQTLADRVLERQLALAHQRERHGTAEGLGRACYAHAVVDPHRPAGPHVSHPEGVYLPVLAALDHGDDPGRPAAQGNKFLERAI